MRLQSCAHDAESKRQLAEFSKWILDIGEGKVPCVSRQGEIEPSWIKIPPEFVLRTNEDKMACIVQSTYPNFLSNYKKEMYLKERAILTPTNESVDMINEHMVAMLPETIKEYLSSDSIAKTTIGHESYVRLYPVEFLNSLNGNNFPQHTINLKIGVPIMLLRNLSHTDGLCNGSRLIVTHLGDRVIEARLITGSHAGNYVFIPRITLNLKSNKYPFELARRQFPIKVCYAMTINKSQGQTLSSVGIYLRRPVFSHGQLYVAFSRVTCKEGLKVIIEDEKTDCTDETRNVVYREVFASFSST
jgi:ATP-dependent exoDNAse (exonuclease V) alpha subunit